MSQSNVISLEQYNKMYTLDEARKLLLEEAEREQERINIEKRNSRRERAYYAKQKLVGLALIVLSIILMVAVKDATASFFMIPIGLLVMFTKAKVITE